MFLNQAMKVFLLLIPLLVMIIVAAYRILVGPGANTAANSTAAGAGAVLPLFGSPVSRQQSSGKQH